MPLEQEIALADLIRRVRQELESLDARRLERGDPALLALGEVELELQFTVVHRKDGKGGVDLKILSLEGSKGVESTAVHRVRVTFSLDEAARQARILGSRAHATAAGGADDDVVPLEGGA